MHQPADGRSPSYRALLTGTGFSLPEKVVSNDDIALRVDTSDEWINTRTGIKRRRVASEKETTGLLASAAARKALSQAGVDPAQLDLIIVGTVTPEMVFPSTACFVQESIGATGAWSFDLAAACSGFVYALSTAQQFIESGRVKKALVIGADCLSKLTNWEDRTTCILFGDGAGAAILEQGTDPDRGILYSTSGSDGKHWEALNCQAYGSRYPASKPLDDPNKIYISIKGREIYQQAVRKIVELIEECLTQCQLVSDQVKMVIPHQMNARIIESVAKRLSLPDEKVFINIADYGNTSAASIPIALAECLEARHVTTGDIVIFVAFGAGMTWGANVIRL